MRTLTSFPCLLWHRVGPWGASLTDPYRADLKLGAARTPDSRALHINLQFPLVVRPFRGLLDSGSSNSFINSAFVSYSKLLTHTIPVINHSFYQVFYHYSFPFLLLSFCIYSVENSVTLCDIMRDRVTSRSRSHVTSQDMSHIVWLGVQDN